MTAILIAMSLGIIFVCATAIIAIRTSAITKAQENNAAHQYAHMVADLAQGCGEGASIEGLKLFLRNVKDNEVLERIHVVRSPVTVKDFDEREDSEPEDDLEREVLRTGGTREVVDDEAHTIRHLHATLAQASCARRCHESAEVGDVLGVVSVTVRTDEGDAARIKLNWIIAAMFTAIGIIEVIFVVSLVGKENAERDRVRMEKTNQQLQAYVQEVETLAEQANAANKAKSEFLANMSHEIRTPMHAILGYAEFLSQEELTAQQNQYADTILDNSRQLLALINDIMDLSKIEAGELRIENTPCSLAQLLQSVEQLLAKSAEEKGLDFRVICHGQLPVQLRCDPLRIQQCLNNLVGNAVKFTERGHVHLNVRLLHERDRTLIQFEVEDTGIGIPVAKQALIFESFSQADSSTCRKYGGTGLGLSITRRLAELLGGTVTLRSREGEGSTFSLILPVEIIDADETFSSIHDIEVPRVSQPQTHLQFAGCHAALVADDVKTNRMLMQGLLERMGLQVSTAEDGHQTVEQALNQSFDLIFMDIQMPRMNGYEATKALRRAGVKVPIVALTAHAMAGDDRKCMDAGCNHYLCKPIDHQKLSEILLQYLPVADRNVAAAPEAQALVSETVRSATGPDNACAPGQEDTEVDVGPGVIDWDQLIARLGDESLVRDIVPVFLNDMQGQFSLLARAMASDDIDAIRHTAHAIKGAAANIAAHVLTDLAFRLEARNHDLSTKEMTALYEALTVEFDTLVRFLSQANWMDMAKHQQRRSHAGTAVHTTHG